MESCKTCKYLRELWWWKDYPKDKQYGHCCVVLEKENVVMQLYGLLDKPGNRCEMYGNKHK